MTKLKWEYRIIQDDLSYQIKKIEQQGGGSVYSEKIKYIISEIAIDQLIFMNNHLKILFPVRKDRRNGYQQWHLVADTSFPAGVSDVYFLLRSLTRSEHWLSRDEYNWSQLLDDLILPDKSIKLIDVEREVHLHYLSDIEVEFAYISFSGYHNTSIAVRDQNSVNIDKIRRHLDLLDEDNRDYVSTLKKYFFRKK